MSDKTLYVVHCIDTEGPLDESIIDTFNRLQNIFGIELPPTLENLQKLQTKKIPLGGLENAVAECIAPELLAYNPNWPSIDKMISRVSSIDFRMRIPDSYGDGWKFSWHCMDHMGVRNNPRNKDLGYGKVFTRYIKNPNLTEYGDEINWHFHPLSLQRDATHAATSYLNSYDVLLEILCRRILEDGWFPVVNRPGFHSERPDSHSFLEQWIPFDYANQRTTEPNNQPDLSNGRFGDWNRAPLSWRGYHPSHDDYQIEGNCRRIIFRCLNLGTRLRNLQESHIYEAFEEAERENGSILSFANHDWRDIQPDVIKVQDWLFKASEKFPSVKFKYAGAEKAALQLYGLENHEKLILSSYIEGNKFVVKVKNGSIFGPQPFLAIKNHSGEYFHDNFDVEIKDKIWTYTLDDQTLPLKNIEKIGVASAGRYGGYSVANIDLS